MAPKATEEKKLVGLPTLVVSPTELGRMIRELEGIDEVLHQAALRQQTEVKLPPTSLLLDKTLELNKVTLTDPSERKLLIQFLTAIKAKAPVLHISFSADPPTAFMEKMVAWLRREIHPLALVTIGLQPNIGAGCVIRSRNKYFDLSLRADFARKKDLLRQSINEKLAPPAPLTPLSEREGQVATEVAAPELAPPEVPVA